MRIYHTEPAYIHEAAPFILENGGKMGGLEFLRAKNASLRKAILPAQVLKADEEWHGATVEPGEGDKYIVRASHPHDFQGLVDVISTEVVEKGADIGKVVDSMRDWAKRDFVMAYGRYENPQYDGNIAIGVQPYVSCWAGSVVEHPNRPGEYVISYVNKNARWNSVSGLKIDTGIYSEAEDCCEGLGGDRIESKKAKKVVQLYKLVERSNLVQNGLSFQMEFLDSGGSVFIAQVRAFHQKKIANFTLEGRERLVFGVTDPEGVELPVLQSPDGFDSDRKPLSSGERWAFLKTQHDGPLRFEFQPQNMEVFLISQSWRSGNTTSLEHYHFRYAQKANVTVFEDQLRFRHDFSRLIYGTADFEFMKLEMRNLEMAAQFSGQSQFELEKHMLQRNAGLLSTRVRVISDGRTATVEPLVADY